MGLTWEKYLSVGNAMIDSDHKNLIIMINNIEYAIGRRDPDELSKTIGSFATYMHIHLRNEEQIAEAVNFPLAQNKLEHQQLMYEIRCMLENLDTKNGDWPDNLAKKYSRFLNDWMMDHIIKKDMQMKPVLRNHPYDFKPD
jgi:hemerythrin